MSSAGNSANQAKPSPKTLRYLRYLAERSGTSFSYPHTAAEAGREIRRLQDLKADSRAEIERERRGVQVDMATRRGDAAMIRDEELTGYGSSATWAGPEREPTEKQIGYLRHLASEAGESFNQPETCSEASEEIERLLAQLKNDAGTAPKITKARLTSGPVVLRHANAPENQPTEPQPEARPHVFAGYTINGEHRLIVVHRIDGLIRVGDLPANSKGKRYLIADELRTCGELDDLLADYNQQIARLHAIPAQRAAVDELLELAL